jgi:hypothetical protein
MAYITTRYRRCLQARNWNSLFPAGKGDTPDRIDYTEEGDGPPTASDRDLMSGASASATEDEGAGPRGAGVSRMDVEDDDYEEVGTRVGALTRGWMRGGTAFADWILAVEVICGIINTYGRHPGCAGLPGQLNKAG